MKQLTALTATIVLAAGVYGLTRLTGDDQPRGIGQPAVLTTAHGPLGLSGPVGCATTFSVPGKAWGNPPIFHYNPSILKPTRLEKVCVTYPSTGGTLAKVSVVAP